jgi:ligand-binding sensor domain-containing protein
MRNVAYWLGLASVAVALHAQAADPWQHVTKATLPSLPGDEIQMIKVWPDKGVLWIGTSSGVARIEGGVLRVLKQALKLKVWDITSRPEGGLWIGHSTGALLVDGERTVPTLQGLNVPAIRLVGTQMWALAKTEATDRNALMQAKGEDWVPVEMVKGRNVLDLVQDSKGTFWLVLDGDGVVEVDPGKKLNEAPRHLARMNVTSIMTDSQGRTWCGLMSGGVMVRQNGVWQRQLDKENSAVLSLIEDGSGKIWAATSGNGIWKLDGTTWSGVLQDEGAVNLLKMTSDKRIWASTQRRGGLRCWDGKVWQDSLESPMPPNSLVELPKGVLVAGSLLDGLYILGDYSIKEEVGIDGKR